MADYQVIPQAALDSLIADPSKAAAFDQVFGTGRAAEVLSNQSPAPEAEEDVDSDWSVMGEAYRAVVGGVRDAAQETGNFAKWLGDSSADLMWGEGNDIFYTDNGWEVLPRNNTEAPEWQQGLAQRPILGDDGIVDLPEVEKNKTIVGGIGRGITQFAAGYLTFSKLTKLQGLKGAFINGALADAIVFNPNDPNVMAIVEDFGVDTGAFGEAMATDPDDPEYINRLRNVAEGALAGAIVEGIGWGVRAARAAKRGDTAAAEQFTKRQAEALKELDLEIARNADTVRIDVKETLELEKRIFEKPDVPSPRTADVEGQIRLDLGDTPAPRAVAAEGATAPAPNRIFLTPEKVEKIRLQSALAAGVPKVTKQSMFSFRSLDTAKDFNEVLDEIAGVKAVMADEFTKIKGGDVQRWATVKAQAAAKLREMADIAGEDPEKLVKRFLSAEVEDITQIAAEVHARSRMVRTVERDLKDMARAITTGQIDPKRFPHIRDMDHLKLVFAQRREVGANLLAGQDALRSNVARAMNAMKIAAKGDKKMLEALKDPTLFNDIDSMARAIVDNADKSALKVAKDMRGPIRKAADTINTVRINFLLSGPGTQEINFMSNLVQMMMIPTRQAIGGIATGDAKMIQHATRTVMGYVLGLVDASRTAARAGWENAAVLDNAMKTIEDDAFLSQGNNVVMKGITLPSRFLMVMDEFFKQAQYRGRIFADAAMDADLNGLRGEEKTRFIQQYIKDSFDESGQALREDALRQARRATFTEPLEGQLGPMLQLMAIKNPAVRFIIPFVRTPINLLSETVQHTPLVGAVSKRWRDDIAAGGVRRAQAIGKWVIGTGLIITAAMMASQGRITGSGPSDPRIRKVWLKENQPYAFRVDNEDGTTSWISYARLEPLSNVFSIAADTMELKLDTYNEVDTKGILQPFLMGVMENTVNKTFTQGISDAMDAFNGEPHAQKRALINFAASFVPNFINQTNGDDILREQRTLMDALMARTHLYNQVDPKRNVLGEPVLRTLPKYDPLGLSESDTREPDPVLREVTKIAIHNQSVADNPSPVIDGVEKIDLREIEYKPGQSLYDRWVELTGTVEIGGKNLREALSDLVTSDQWNKTPMGGRGSPEKGTKGDQIRRYITMYRKAAKAALPELQNLEMAAKKGEADAIMKEWRLLNPSTAPKPLPARRSFEELLKQ